MNKEYSDGAGDEEEGNDEMIKRICKKGVYEENKRKVEMKQEDKEGERGIGRERQIKDVGGREKSEKYPKVSNKKLEIT